MNKIFALLPLLFLFQTACTRSGDKVLEVKGRTPVETVNEFILLSGTAKKLGDKRRLEELTAGEMRRAFSQMSDEAFKITYLNNLLTINEVKILESSQDGETAKVVYSVSVENAQGTDLTRETNIREVILTPSQGSWYIESLRPRGSDRVAFTKGMIF